MVIADSREAYCKRIAAIAYNQCMENYYGVFSYNYVFDLCHNVYESKYKFCIQRGDNIPYQW